MARTIRTRLIGLVLAAAIPLVALFSFAGAADPGWEGAMVRSCLAALAVAPALVWASGLSDEITGVSERLAADMAAVGRGELSRRCSACAGREPARLVAAFNLMADALERRQREDARAHHTALEDRAKAETALMQAQKMEVIGQLAGGLAHDFNNLLTVVLGNAEILREELEDPHHRELASMIERVAMDGAGLAKALLDVSKRRQATPQPIRLDEVVGEIAPLLERAVGSEATIALETAPAWALADRVGLESAILNLVINARDAMAKGGCITIRTGATPSAGIQPCARSAFITVSDTGSGMPPDVLEHVFEPFFTTKEIGKGSGLGLAMVFGFTKQAGGEIDIQSTLGVGTSVTMTFPDAQPDSAAPTDPAHAPQAPALRPTGRVLVVEDDQRVQDYVCSQLARLGYEVTPASSGREALTILGGQEPFDLLLSDISLPGGMNGRELAETALASLPRLKILLTSGSDESAFYEILTSEFATIAKPFRRQTLANAVASALSG
jgi:signal transduction histidine kinase/CheY-like chemotaxis protein